MRFLGSEVPLYVQLRHSLGGVCRMAPLVVVPHTTMCMGVDSFTEENRSPLHVLAYISL